MRKYVPYFFQANFGNTATTQQVLNNPGHSLLAGKNQAGTYGSIAQGNARSTQYQQVKTILRSEIDIRWYRKLDRWKHQF